jgi:hypothetical protein
MYDPGEWNLMKLIGLLLLMALVATCMGGCAGNPMPYAELGAGYQANKGNYYLDFETQYDMDCGQFWGAIGAEWEDGWSLEYSHLSCIDPRLAAEMRMDNIMLIKRWGGQP